jgi:hypothetical protein
MPDIPLLSSLVVATSAANYTSGQKAYAGGSSIKLSAANGILNTDFLCGFIDAMAADVRKLKTPK